MELSLARPSADNRRTAVAVQAPPRGAGTSALVRRRAIA